MFCLCQGDPNKVIARKLGMTETTVKVHVREIMRKLGVVNRTQVAIVAGRNTNGCIGGADLFSPSESDRISEAESDRTVYSGPRH
jgi:hypothetical protein